MVQLYLMRVSLQEELVLMVESCWEHWKYPVGYVLDDKIYLEDPNHLLSRKLDFCVLNDIKVRCVTSGGTTVESLQDGHPIKQTADSTTVMEWGNYISTTLYKADTFLYMNGVQFIEILLYSYFYCNERNYIMI